MTFAVGVESYNLLQREEIVGEAEADVVFAERDARVAGVGIVGARDERREEEGEKREKREETRPGRRVSSEAAGARAAQREAGA